MTTHQAKADAKRRLTQAQVPFTKLTAHTVSFADLARCAPVFVTIHGAHYHGLGTHLRAELFADVPKPSEGGYILEFNDCHWQHRD